MKEFFLTVFRLSRPRFWLYLAGPYLIGVTVASSTTNFVSSVSFLYTLSYFLIPANILLYGINDISDKDTDKFNPKKDEKELRFGTKFATYYYLAIGISTLLSLPLFGIFLRSEEWLLLFLFFFLLIFYSSPPFRFKKRPFIDSLSNVLYIMPGVLGYVHISGSMPSLLSLLAAGSWAVAMHLFSAIPDISSDKKAGLTTTAVVLGKNKSLVLCAVLWSMSVLPLAAVMPALLLFSFYPLLPVVLFNSPPKTIEKVYWYFPYINLVSGFFLWLLYTSKFLL